MKKSILTLLALLFCVIQTTTAYEYFTIFFTDGTKSEAFYATDVDSICYSKLSLDSIAYDDWQVQEIYTCDSVYRYPLAQIDSLSFKNVNEDVVKSDIEKISDTVIPLYMQSSSLSEISAYIPIICQTDGVEDAWTDNQSLFIKIRDWGTICFIYPLRRNSTKSDIVKSRQFNHLLRRSMQDYNSNDAHNICIVNQMYNARQFDYDTELKDSLANDCKLWGLDTIRVNVPTRDFYKNEIFDYDIVFLDTHGFYDYKGLHWLLTGEKVMQSINEYDSSQEINTTIEELLDWPLLWKERIFSLKYGSPLDISLSWVKDSLDNGKWRADCYVAVSQNFIKSSQKKFKSKGKAIVFNAACQSVKGDPGLASVFTKEKGAGVYLGYDDTNSVGGQAGVHYIEYLLSGKSVECVYNEMWKDVQMCKLCKQDTILDNHRIQPKLMSYTYGIRTDTLRITHPLTLDVEEIKMDNDAIGYVFKGEMRTNNDSFYEKNNRYGLYVSEYPDFNKCETIGDIQLDYSQESKIIWSCPAIVLNPNKQYYYMAAFADGYNDGYSDCYGEIKSFTTKEAEEDISDYVAYAVLNDSTLTFYYDNKKNEKTGTKYEIAESYNWEGNPWRHYINKVIFDSSFAKYTPISTAYWFYSCSELKKIENLQYLNTSKVTDMKFMFRGCESLISLDLSGFNTKNVTDMSYMFGECNSLVSLDVSNFNTANVKDMPGMFNACCSLTTLDLSSFNTANVRKMNYMFQICRSLTSLDLSSFNTSNVTGMTDMFSGCSSLASLDLSSFNTSNVTDMRDMFSGCSSLASLDLSSFNTSNVTGYGLVSMFYYCKSLTSLDLSNFNTANVVCLAHMFGGCKSLTILDISNFTVSSIDVSGIFDSCISLRTIYGNDWSNPEYSGGIFGGIFDNCKELVGGQGTKIGDNYGYDNNGNPFYYYCGYGGNYAHIDGGKDNPGLFTAK